MNNEINAASITSSAGTQPVAGGTVSLNPSLGADLRSKPDLIVARVASTRIVSESRDPAQSQSLQSLRGASGEF
jgi:hypothetical protein